MKNKKKLLWILQAHSQAHQSHLLSCPVHNLRHCQLLLIPDHHKRIHHTLPRLPCLHWWISWQKISPHHPNAHMQENLWKWNTDCFRHVQEEIRTEHCEHPSISYSLKSLAARALLLLWFIPLSCFLFSLASVALTWTWTCLHSLTLISLCWLYSM